MAGGLNIVFGQISCSGGNANEEKTNFHCPLVLQLHCWQQRL